MAAIPAPCACVECMMPSAGPEEPGQLNREPCCPRGRPGQLLVWVTRAGACGVQSRRKHVSCPQAAWSSWHAAEKWQARGMCPCTWGQASPLACCSASDQASQGLRTRNVFSVTLHPASAGPRHPDQELARTAARTARPSVQLPRLRRPSRRHHAFHTGARRWNRGHSSDLAKSTNSNRKGLEGRLSPTFPREQNPELYSSTLYGKDVRPAEANHRSRWVGPHNS